MASTNQQWGLINLPLRNPQEAFWAMQSIRILQLKAIGLFHGKSIYKWL